jgi:hypothetical protein
LPAATRIRRQRQRNSYLLADHIPHAELIIYPDAGHGFLLLYSHRVNNFLGAT